MAQRKRNVELVKDEETVPEESNEPGMTFTFEPVTDELMSQLTVWGNMTQTTSLRIKERYPGWAEMLDTVFMIVGEAIKEHVK